MRAFFRQSGGLNTRKGAGFGRVGRFFAGGIIYPKKENYFCAAK